MRRSRSRPRRPGCTCSSRSRWRSPAQGGAQMIAGRRAAPACALMVGTMKRYDPAYERLVALSGELQRPAPGPRDHARVPVRAVCRALSARLRRCRRPRDVLDALNVAEERALDAAARRRRRADALVLPLDPARQPRARAQRAARRARRAHRGPLRRPRPALRERQPPLRRDRLPPVLGRPSRASPATSRSSRSTRPTSV